MYFLKYYNAYCGSNLTEFFFDKLIWAIANEKKIFDIYGRFRPYFKLF